MTTDSHLDPPALGGSHGADITRLFAGGMGDAIAAIPDNVVRTTITACFPEIIEGLQSLDDYEPVRGFDCVVMTAVLASVFASDGRPHLIAELKRDMVGTAEAPEADSWGWLTGMTLDANVVRWKEALTAIVQTPDPITRRIMLWFYGRFASVVASLKPPDIVGGFDCVVMVKVLRAVLAEDNRPLLVRWLSGEVPPG